MFDRLRAVRQDLVIQHCGGEDSVEILEKVVRFLLYSDYRYNYLFLHCCGEDSMEILEKVVRFLIYSDYR